MSSPTRTAINFRDLMNQRARKPIRSPLVKKDRDRPVVQPPVQKILTSPIPNRGPAAGRPPPGHEAPVVKDGPSFGAWLTGIGPAGLQNPRNAQSFKRYVTELYLSKLKGALSQMSQQIQSDIQDPQMARLVMKAIVDTVAGGVGAIAKGEVPDPAQRAASTDDAVTILLRLAGSETSSKNVRSALNYIRNAVKNGLDAKQAARDFRSKYPTAFADIMDYIGSYPSAETELRALQMVASVQNRNDMKIQETIRDLLAAGYKADAVKLAADLMPEALTAGRKVKVPEKDVEYTIDCLPETDLPIEGNAMASGDDAADKAAEDEIREQLESGNEWAWCTVRVTAKWKNWTGVDFLGGCSYTGEADFKTGGYYEDMKKQALESLKASVQHHADEAEGLEREEEATEASVKTAARYEVEESKVWKNKATGATASPYGAVPWTSDRDKANWSLVSQGWTTRDNKSNTVGTGRKPFADKQEAQTLVDKLNSEYQQRVDKFNADKKTKSAKLTPQQMGIIEDLLEGMDPSDPAYKALSEYAKGLKTQGPQKGQSVGIQSLAEARKSRIAQRKLAGKKVRIPESEVTYTIEAEDEESSPDVLLESSDDADADAQMVQEIKDRLDRGDTWAWCTVKVTAKWKKWEGDDYLGQCSYDSEADFKKDGYYEDMKAEALADLRSKVQAHADDVDTLERDEDEPTQASVRRRSTAGVKRAKGLGIQEGTIQTHLDVMKQLADKGDIQGLAKRLKELEADVGRASKRPCPCEKADKGASAKPTLAPKRKARLAASKK